MKSSEAGIEKHLSLRGQRSSRKSNGCSFLDYIPGNVEGGKKPEIAIWISSMYVMMKIRNS